MKNHLTKDTLSTLKRAVEEHKSGTIQRIIKKRLADGAAAEQKAKELGDVERIIDRKLAPVVDVIHAQQERIDDATGNAFRMAAEIAAKLKLTSKEQRVFDALLETSGNELAAAQSLATRYPQGRGFSRSNIQRIRVGIERRMGDLGYSHPRTFWAKSRPLAGKNSGTSPAR
jgi:hypothetical protein